MRYSEIGYFKGYLKSRPTFSAANMGPCLLLFQQLSKGDVGYVIWYDTGMIWYDDDDDDDDLAWAWKLTEAQD